MDPADPSLPLYQDLAHRLAPCPLDAATGSYMVAAGVPFAVPHRHYSHLLSVYDLGTSGVEHMAPSVDLWWNITCAGPQAEWPDWQGDCECRWEVSCIGCSQCLLRRGVQRMSALTS